MAKTTTDRTDLRMDKIVAQLGRITAGMSLAEEALNDYIDLAVEKDRREPFFKIEEMMTLLRENLESSIEELDELNTELINGGDADE